MKKLIEVPILNDAYMVVVCIGNAEYLKKTLKKYSFPKDEDSLVHFNGRLGMCLSSKGCHPVIALPHKPKTALDIGVLTHEAVHSIQSIFKTINSPLDGELFAHSVEAVVRITLKHLKEK